jgi:hypothetical protein
MGRKVAAVLFASAVLALVSAGPLSVAQESAAQPARSLRTSGPPAVYDDSQSAPDQDLPIVEEGSEVAKEADGCGDKVMSRMN